LGRKQSPNLRRSFERSTALLLLGLIAISLTLARIHDPPPLDIARRFDRTLRAAGTDAPELQSLFLDASRDLGERIGALRRLQDYDRRLLAQAKETNTAVRLARTEHVARVALELATTRPDSEVRAELVRLLTGVEYASVEAPLQVLLQHDPSEGVRARATGRSRIRSTGVCSFATA